MDNEENSKYEEWENDDNVQAFRSKLMVVSNHCVRILVHINVNQLNDTETEELQINMKEETKQSVTQTIIDDSQITKNFNIN